ncbi:MAG: xanthine phosphoribosyltransferase [Bacteroidales bacterium]|nr:xanthine phosphoribosyltransferase [Bacteroidales bacterium]MBQ7490147.1 xanthine phosphoribosyltransferase [Bacteroidales bacterium]
MEELKQRILRDGRAKAEGNIVQVSSFLNHQLDPQLMMHCAEEFARIFKDKGVNKIVTIEASGIAPAIMTGYLMKLPVVFIKKKIASNLDETWQSWVWSFTRSDNTTVCIDRRFLTADDRILFIDDFLADGHASGSVIHLCRQSGAQIVAMGFLVEKGFATGGQFLRDHNIYYHALATIKRIKEDNSIELA